MYSKLIFVALTILIGCNNENLSKDNQGKSTDTTSTLSEKKVDAIADTTGFLANCQNWNSGSFVGYLQGIDASKDSLGPFCFYECYDCKQTFRIILAYKDIFKLKTQKPDFIFNEFKNGCTSFFPAFNCFAFIYPIRDPDKQKNVHAMNIDFPILMKAYKRVTNDSWKFVNQIEVKTFRELSQSQFNIIYSNN